MDKIICVGKNYLEHAKELGDAVPEKPVLFLKPPSSAVFVERSGASVIVELPQGKGSVHPECEIVVLLGKNLEIEAVTLGLDLTLRDLQTQLKKAGHPWEAAKAFPNAAVVGPWQKNIKELLQKDFEYLVNEKLRQHGNASAMRMKIDECTCYAAGVFKVLPGDIVFTGTPAGVSAVVSGDKSLLRWGEMSFEVEWK